MSTCQTRQVGAVLTKDNRTIADGFNGNLPGHIHCTDGGCDRCADGPKSGEDLSRCRCTHAEQSVVAYCARKGVAMENSVLYVSCMPCSDCLKLILFSGVAEIVYDDIYLEIYKSIKEICATSSVKLRTFKCTCKE